MADLWTTPAGTPPSGVESNLVDPETNKKIPQVTLSFLISIATICVALRLYVQLRVTKNMLSMEDYCLLLALPMNIAYTGIIIWMSEVGMISRHIWDIPLAYVFMLLRWTRVVNSVPQPITGLIKLSLLFLYRRIFGPNKALRWISNIGIVIVAAVYISFTFTFALLESFNNPVVIRLSLVQAGFNIGTDVILFLMPIAGIIRLHLSTSRKFIIIGVFSTGLAAILMSCLTLYWRSTTPGGAYGDTTWAAASIFTVSVVELDIGIMCACMPVFAPLLPKLNEFAKGCSDYIHSKRRGLFVRSSQKTGDADSQQSGHPYNYVDAEPSIQKRSGYLELSEVKPNTPKPGSKNWFDRSIMRETNITTSHSINDERDSAV